MNTVDEIYEELEGLPEPMAREVLDFAKFLKQKSEQENLMNAQESSLNAIWDNDDDEIWNNVPTR